LSQLSPEQLDALDKLGWNITQVNLEELKHGSVLVSSQTEAYLIGLDGEVECVRPN
jgi:hypothetical protein